jgi:hypothetical protein
VENLRNKLMLGLMIVAVEVTAGTEAGVEAVVNNPTQPSTMQNIYSGITTRLSQAKNAATNLLFSGATKTDNVPKGMTVAQAFLLVQQLIINKPQDDAVLNKYWQTKSSFVLSCAKLLPEETEKQILKALQEIDKRLLYWFYQKEHQWQYFFSKNPLKWVMGKSQDVEIETNIEQLHAKQDELYTRLGELSAIDWHQYLVAWNNYQAAYAWIEKLLNIVAGIKEESAAVVSSDNYDVIVNSLYEKLKTVGVYASTALSSLEATIMPYHITRNWVRYGALMMAGHLAYNSPVVAEFVKSLPQKATDLQVTFYTNVEVAKNLINETFFGGRSGKASLAELLGGNEGGGLLIHSETREETRKELEGFLKSSVAEGWFFAGVSAATKDEQANILAAFDKNNWAPFFSFLKQALAKAPKTKQEGRDYLINGLSLLLQVVSACTGNNLEQAAFKVFDRLDKESQGIRNLALLAPAVLGVGVGAFGLSKVYGRLTKYDYGPIRLALVAISSLFVDTTKPLDDLDYGKMIFLIYNLKEKAKRELPVKGNVRNDFIKDLERVESREFDSAAKRRIIKDMFKKYSFLGLVQ